MHKYQLGTLLYAMNTDLGYIQAYNRDKDGLNLYDIYWFRDEHVSRGVDEWQVIRFHNLFQTMHGRNK